MYRSSGITSTKNRSLGPAVSILSAHNWFSSALANYRDHGITYGSPSLLHRHGSFASNTPFAISQLHGISRCLHHLCMIIVGFWVFYPQRTVSESSCLHWFCCIRIVRKLEVVWEARNHGQWGMEAGAFLTVRPERMQREEKFNSCCRHPWDGGATTHGHPPRLCMGDDC